MPRLIPRALCTVACAVILVGPSVAQADDVLFGLRGGYYTQIEEPFVGVELLFKFAPSLYFNPNFEYVFVENGTYMTFNGDFHYDLPTHSRTFIWLGAGLGLLRADPDGPAPADSDAALNVLAGVGARTGGVIPYVQAKLIVRNDSIFSIAFGLRF